MKNKEEYNGKSATAPKLSTAEIIRLASEEKIRKIQAKRKRVGEKKLILEVESELMAKEDQCGERIKELNKKIY